MFFNAFPNNMTAVIFNIDHGHYFTILLFIPSFRGKRMTRILILNGHPAPTSISSQIATEYAGAAREAGNEVRRINLHDLSFDMDFGHAGYRETKPLEPELQAVLDDLSWCEHLVLISPMWWGGLPAKLKGLFDRILLPGIAFDPRRRKFGLPAPLFTGRTARVIISSDTPGWAFRLFYSNALLVQIRYQILKFIGIQPSRFLHLTGASHAEKATVERWLGEARALGARAA